MEPLNSLRSGETATPPRSGEPRTEARSVAPFIRNWGVAMIRFETLYGVASLLYLFMFRDFAHELRDQ